MSLFPPGRGSQLTPDQRTAIQHLALIEGCTKAEIARRTGRDRGTIADVLKAEDSAALAQQLVGERREAALRVLVQGVEPAAHAWRRAAEIAADKGDHRAARDLLLATDVIAADRTNTGVVIIIGTPENPIRMAPPGSGQTSDES